ncbi:translation initiation factor IF-2-like [Sciurus carolinensis]|uniref:translation initiation factor IF-2-like n=1 Tax=Sciurus carolinensis TaxID=30640 RepID=UPI001FB47FBB|nr:translation initiation factor IF-2-like [Sciurus carolinensis]XP_047406401.1 translation initiation factor IF-2-like [Sciurus carolinensis]XP_047406402.1 translation initiation factor IF-2-like [Sciurus carolinensis]XP_047406404.1 translation initiation factor IF-2-like [Sciurus carolinensis]XP_047406405.1 translation initiation factor IF-2-like [Sciurus carolinensis]XP_047406406.1 translation initiation factor IF-2-like [Sciurus carolinensis]XP_047406407.1 translation initiation factor IF
MTRWPRKLAAGPKHSEAPRPHSVGTAGRALLPGVAAIVPCFCSGPLRQEFQVLRGWLAGSGWGCSSPSRSSCGHQRGSQTPPSATPTRRRSWEPEALGSRSPGRAPCAARLLNSRADGLRLGPPVWPTDSRAVTSRVPRQRVTSPRSGSRAGHLQQKPRAASPGLRGGSRPGPGRPAAGTRQGATPLGACQGPSLGMCLVPGRQPLAPGRRPLAGLSDPPREGKKCLQITHHPESPSRCPRPCQGPEAPDHLGKTPAVPRGSYRRLGGSCVLRVGQKTIPLLNQWGNRTQRGPVTFPRSHRNSGLGVDETFGGHFVQSGGACCSPSSQ